MLNQSIIKLFNVSEFLDEMPEQLKKDLQKDAADLIAHLEGSTNEQTQSYQSIKDKGALQAIALALDIHPDILVTISDKIVHGHQETQTEEEKAPHNPLYGQRDIPEHHTTTQFPHTIYAVMHQLGQTQVALGKNSGIKLEANEDGDLFFAGTDDLAPIAKELMDDVYAIIERKELKQTSLTEALTVLRDGGEIAVHYQDDTHTISSVEDLKKMPLHAAFEGIFYKAI